MKHFALWALLPWAVVADGVYAEVVRIPLGQQHGALQEIERPTLGMTQESVLSQYGEPVQRYAAVGEPPISRWQYPTFTVYFEGNIVMHSVVQHRSASGLDDSEVAPKTLEE